MAPTPSLRTGSQPVMSPPRAMLRVPPYFGVSVDGLTASCCGFSSVGVAGVDGATGEVGDVGDVGVVGAAAGAQAAITSDSAISTLTTNQRIFFIFFLLTE